MNNNPFIPGGNTISPIGRGISSAVVEMAATALGLDKDNIDLDAEFAELLRLSKIAQDNKDYAGYLFYIQKGVFLAVLKDDYDTAMQFAKDFLVANNPKSSLMSTIDPQDVSRIAAGYAALIMKDSGGQSVDPGEDELTVRQHMCEKVHIHSATKLVAREVRFAVVHDAQDHYALVDTFVDELYNRYNQEPTNNPHHLSLIDTKLREAKEEIARRYNKAKKDKTPAALGGFAMQLFYNYALFVNMGVFQVTALVDLLAWVNASTDDKLRRIADIPAIFQDDFEPNKNYDSE